MITTRHRRDLGGGMFGLGDNNQASNDSQQSGATAVPGATDTVNSLGAARASYPLTPAMPSGSSAPTLPTVAAPLETKPSTIDTGSTNQTPTTPDSGINGVHLENAYIPADPPTMDTTDNDSNSAKPTASSLLQDNTQEDGLIKLKQQALQSLAPLVDQLDQSPEEKFKTTMMLIQASDNAELVHEAYDAANKIEDEKARARALLDVVNEINYFTQHHDEEPA